MKRHNNDGVFILESWLELTTKVWQVIGTAANAYSYYGLICYFL